MQSIRPPDPILTHMPPRPSPAGTRTKEESVVKRNSTRFVGVVLVALAGLVAGLPPALASAPQHHDQQPGFYRVRVGELEVTALFDGTGVFDPHWLNGPKATMDGIARQSSKIRTCWMLSIAPFWSTPATN